MIGRSLAHYRITAAIGAGGMGEVYRATDTRLGRDVALKVLPAGMESSPERLDRFRREARAVAALNHPNIVTIHSVEEADGIPFLTMELVEGDPLDRLIPEGGLEVGRILEIASALAGALAAAHERGIVHRDLKPANLMVTRDGRLKVLDFGLAKVGGPADGPGAGSELPTEARTREGVVLGTMPYMSPEQVEGRPVDHRTDVFSLGVVLYEMATGTRPFSGPSAAALASAILRDLPRPLSELRPDLPGDLGRLVDRCLEKAREARFQTAKDIREELEALRRSPDAGLSRSRPAAGTPESGGTRRPSIVVLPFANLSPDPDNEYFSDGLTEEIIADLSRVRALRVISRTSAMQLKGARKDVRAIGRELGVRYVLEGGVRKAGGSLRITAQLIDAEDDTHVWSEKYNGTVDDVFAVQERVSREIVRALDVTLTSDDDRRLAERPIANPRVYELFLRARQELRRLGGEAIGRATKLLAQAVEIEGETPPLKALRAWTMISLARTGLHLDERPLDEAERLSRELVEEVPGSPYGHALLGSVSYERGDLAGAVRNFVAALEIEPNDAEALFFLGISFIAAGQNERAWETSRRLLASDPLSPLAWSLAGATRWFVGRFEEALPDLLHAEGIDPQNFMLVWTSGYTFAALGRLDEAANRGAILREVGSDATYTRQLLSLLEALEGKPEAALQRLSTLDLAPLDAHNKFHLAESFAMAGDTDRAFELLEAAVEQGFHPFPFISEHCPFFAPLRSLAPFARISERARSLTDAFRESEQRFGRRG